MSWTTGTQTEALAASNAVGTAYASSTTPTSVSPATGAAYVPANFFLPSYGAAKSILLKAYGVLSTTSTPNLTLGVTANTTQGTYNGSGILATTGAVAMQSAVSNVAWDLELLITCVAAGATGTFLAFGRLNIATGTTAVQSIRCSSSAANPNTAVTLSTQSAYYLEVFATWGTSSASNTLTVDQIATLGLN